MRNLKGFSLGFTIAINPGPWNGPTRPCETRCRRFTAEFEPPGDPQAKAWGYALRSLREQTPSFVTVANPGRITVELCAWPNAIDQIKVLATRANANAQITPTRNRANVHFMGDPIKSNSRFLRNQNVRSWTSIAMEPEDSFESKLRPDFRRRSHGNPHSLYTVAG